MKLRDEFDLDGDKIDDSLEDQILNLKTQPTTEMNLIIELQEPVTGDILNSFLNLGGKITSGPWKSSVYGFAGTMPAGQIRVFAQQNYQDLLLIQQDSLGEVSMAFAAQQVGVRPLVWDVFNLTGDWNSSIAVLDTGIDPTHIDFGPGYSDKDFNSKIVGWVDFTANGNNATPYDDNGHGSHVAGIAAGNGFTTRDTFGRVVATKAGEVSYFYEALLIGPGVYERTIIPLLVNQTGWIEIQFNWTDTSLFSTASVHNISLWRGSTPLVTVNTTLNDTVHTLQWEVYPSELGYYYLNMTTVIGDFLGSPFIPMPAVTLRAEVHFPMEDLPDGDPLWTGIANNTRLVSVKVATSSGSVLASDVIDAIEWVIANRVDYHITVMSLSLTINSNDGIINAVENAVNSGIIVVVAAGNNGAGTNQVSSYSPANADSVITVGAVNRFGNISSYSSQGGESASQLTIKPDVVAPGGSLVVGDIFSADANSGDTSYMGDSYPDDAGMMSGTSMATPVVSGAAALLIQALGGSNSWNYTRDEALRVKGLLCMTSTETYPLMREMTPQHSPTLDRGAKDVHEGYGLINPYAAITAVLHNITVGEEVSSTLYTAGDITFQNNRHAWARHVDLTANATHSYIFNLSVAATGDFDLYLYSNNTNFAGEPLILRQSCKNQLGGNEIVYYNCTQPESLYLVVKAVSGNGEFKVAVTMETVDDPTTPAVIRVGHDPIILATTTPVKILAMVQDYETGIANVNVYYTADILSGWDVAEMQLESDGVYSATIGTFPTGLVYYYINASNQISNWGWNPTGAPNEFYDFVVTNSSFGGDFSVLYVHDSDNEMATSPTVKACYESALQGIGVPFTYWNTMINGTPSYNDLKDYSAVVWSLGYLATLNASECMSLWNYLEHGGKLFLSGLWIAFTTTSTNATFLQDYLKISYLGYTFNFGSVPVTELGRDGDPLSGNLNLTVNGGDGTNTFVVVENIGNLSGSVPLFNTSTSIISGTGNISATRYSGSYQLVLLDFSFEAINSSSDRQEIMRRSLEWFGYGQGLVSPPNATDILYYHDLDPVNNTITINGSAWGDLGINHTRFYIDNFWCANDSTLDYSYEWDTTLWPDRPSTVTFVAYDSYWHVNSTNVILVVDNLPPQDLTLGGLANDSYISGLYTIKPEFNELSGVDRVEYSVNNSLNFTTYGPGYAWTWDTTTFEDGWWELNVTVFSVLNLSATIMATVAIDNVLPSNTITAPLNYTSVQGTRLIQASASDNIAIDRVEFWVNGTQIYSDTIAPYETSWQTSDFGDGWVYVEARAYDFASNVNISNVIINNDNRAPEYVSIAPLTNGTWINETYAVNVICQDPSGFDRVEFAVNGSLNATDFSAPYSWNWDTTLLDDGWWELNVTAFSVLNHSATVIVTVLIDDALPSINITSPLNDTILQGTIPVQFDVSDGAGIDRVEFWVNGTYYDTDSTAPYDFLWVTTDFPDGWNLVEVRAFDIVQHMNASTVFVILDNWAPENLDIAPTTNGTWINATYLVNATCQDLSGVDRVEFSVNGSLNFTDTTEMYQWGWDTTFFEDGWWELNVTAFSVLEHQTTILATILIDNHIPNVNITEPTNQTIVNGAFWIEVNATDANGIDRVEFYVGGVPYDTDYTSPYNLWFDSSTVPDGWITVEVHAFDYLGKENLTRFEFLIDNAPPLVFITNPANNSIFTGTQSVEVTATETPGISITSVEFYLNGSLNSTDFVSPFSWSWDTTNQETGEWNLTVRAYSSTGRVNETWFFFIVDHNASWVDITSPTPLLLVTGQFLVTFSAVDNYGVGTCQLFVDGYLNGTLNNPPYQFLWDTTLCGEGLHELNVTVFDLAGNQNSSTLLVRVDTIAPMVSVFTSYAGIYLEGNVTFAANASDSNGVKNVTLSIDGSLFGTNTTNFFEFNVTTTTIADGIHTFTFTAYDMAGKTNSTSFTIWINNYAPVISSFTLPGTITAGSDVIATVQISDPFLQSVVLHYSVDGGTTWEEISLTPSSVVTYSGTILGASLQAGTTLKYYVTAIDATGKIGYYQSYNASNPLQIEIGQSLIFYLIIVVIAAAAVAVTSIVVLKVRKGRSKGVSKKEVKAAEKAVTPPVKNITAKGGKPPTSASGKVFAEPTQSLMPPLTGGKGEVSSTEKLTVKFKVEGGQMITPSTRPRPTEEKAGIISPAVEQAPVTPAPSKSQPIDVITPNRYVYCATCSQYYEIAARDLRVGITCSTCNNPLQVTLTCANCQGMLSIDIGSFLKGKNMQAPCPNCGKPVRIL